jgi:aminoglycoside phosphotransferase (APT) family kinase protein
MAAAHRNDPGSSQLPPAQGVRVDWSTIPEQIRGAFEQWLGSSIISIVSQPSGFSPGVAVRLRMADGSALFAKAIGPEPNPGSPSVHRHEARIAAALPAVVPVPRLMWSYDQGDGGWVMLVFEDVDGRHPELPWRPDELERVLEALVTLNTALTPSPLPPPTTRSASAAFAERICGWKHFRDAHPSRLAQLDPWSLRYLDALIDLEAQAPAAVAGDTLLHFDVRADNVLLTPEHVWFVDWPHACIGAAWVDVVCFAPSVTMQGGPAPEHVGSYHPAYRAADPAAVNAAVAAVTGFFVHNSLQPPPPGLPTLRAFQAAQGAVAREWLAMRTAWLI